MHFPTCHSPCFISHVLFKYIYGLLLAYKMPCYNSQFQINIILTNQSHDCVLWVWFFHTEHLHHLKCRLPRCKKFKVY